MTCCRKGKFCTCRWGTAIVGIALLAALFALLLSMAGCAAGKKFERGPDGKMTERVVVGFDVATAAEGVNATIGSLTDPGTLAALAGVGVPAIGIVGALIGKWRGERKGWDEAKAEAEAARKLADAAYDEGAARKIGST